MRLSLVIPLAVFVVGCGGGGGSVLKEESLRSGDLQASGTGLRAYATSGGSATVYGISGNITKLVHNDVTPTLAETEIYFADKFNGALNAISPDGTGLRKLASVGDVFLVRVSPGGSWIYYQEVAAVGLNLKRVSTTGGTPTTVVAGTKWGFALTPDGSKLIYSLPSNYIYVANADGTSPVLLQTTYSVEVVHCFDNSHFLSWDGSNMYVGDFTPYTSLTSYFPGYGATFGVNPKIFREYNWNSGLSTYEWRTDLAGVLAPSYASEFFTYGTELPYYARSFIGPDERS